MNFWSQSLNKNGSILFAGRAHWPRYPGRKSVHLEWYLLHRVKWAFSIYAEADRDGENGPEILWHIALPWLISIYLTVPGFKISGRVGLSIHNVGLWIYIFSRTDGWDSTDPWWKSGLHWSFPWEWSWYSTEILEHKSPDRAKSVYIEKPGDLKRLGIDSFEQMKRQGGVAAYHAKAYPYRYVTKIGEVQDVAARIHVERRTWRRRWWWLLPVKKRSTTIAVNFSQAVGEERGSWKGGCVGCGYDILPDETPRECLKRMERERRFER